MEIRNIVGLKQFSEEKMKKINLFETQNMFCDIYCFRPGQFQKPHTHTGSDKIYHVLEGSGTFSVGGESRVLSAGESTWAPAGREHGVANDSGGDLVCLVFMAPHPEFKRK